MNMDYFTSVDAKPAISSQTVFIDGCNPDELLAHIRLTREAKMNPTMREEINQLFVKWTELLFCGFNIVVKGPGSKYALLETYVTNFLESGRVPDFDGTNSFLDIHSIILNGMEPVDLESFHHAVMNITEKKKVTDKDYKNFIAATKQSKIHQVFVIHSYELLFKESRDIYDLIIKLYFMDPTYVHIIMSSDYYNGAKKLGPVKFSARLLSFAAPYTESFFEEKLMFSEQIAFDTGKDATQVHKLLDSMADLQSLKDTYQALGNANKVMVYIIEDFVQKSGITKSSDNGGESVAEPKRLRSEQKDDSVDRRKTRSRSIETHLDFHDLFNHLQAKFILRRNTVLRQQLNELRDHNIIEYDETGNKIQCIIKLGICKKFLEFVQGEQKDRN